MVAFRSGKCLLRQILKEAGITQAELSRKLKCPVTQVSDWVNDRKKMSLDTCKNISYLLDIPMESLYEWEQIRISERKRRREQE